MKVLIIEDDLELFELLRDYLQKFSIDSELELDLGHILKKISSNEFDLIILDLGLGDKEGLDYLREIRKVSDIPIIISSARNDVSDKVLGLELGANDYIAKPYSPRELVARIRAQTKRKEQSEAKIHANKSLKLDPQNLAVIKNGKTIFLTKAEFDILNYLYKNKDRICTRDEIIKNTSSITLTSIDKTIDVIISRLRKKIEDDPSNPKYIKSIRGMGYKFVDEDSI